MKRLRNSSPSAPLTGSGGEVRTGQWSVPAVQARYVEYARMISGEISVPPAPREHVEGNVRWVYPIMQSVIEGIEHDDKACIALGLDFIEEDGRFPFGKVLKSNTARALRRATLKPDQAERVRERIAKLFLAGQIPHEFREYAKLLRHVGLGKWWPIIEQHTMLTNPYVKRYYEYFRAVQMESNRIASE